MKTLVSAGGGGVVRIGDLAYPDVVHLRISLKRLGHVASGGCRGVSLRHVEDFQGEVVARKGRTNQDTLKTGFIENQRDIAKGGQLVTGDRDLHELVAARTPGKVDHTGRG